MAGGEGTEGVPDQKHNFNLFFASMDQNLIMIMINSLNA